MGTKRLHIILLLFTFCNVLLANPVADSTQIASIINKGIQEADPNDSKAMILSGTKQAELNGYFELAYKGYSQLKELYQVDGNTIDQIINQYKLIDALEKWGEKEELLSSEHLYFGKQWIKFDMHLKAKESFSKALALAKKNAQRIIEKQVLYEIVNTYDATNELQLCIPYIIKLISASTSPAEKTLFLQKLATAYRNANDPKNALLTYASILEQTDSSDYNLYAIALNNLAHSYYTTGNKPKAITYFNQALSICKDEKLKQLLPKIYSNIGVSFLKENDLDNALKQFLNAARYLKPEEDSEAFFINNEYLYKTYSAKEDYYNALIYSELSLDKAIKTGILKWQAQLYRDNADIFREIYDFEKSVEYYEEYMRIKDILRESESEIRIQTGINNRFIEEELKNLEGLSIEKKIALLEEKQRQSEELYKLEQINALKKETQNQALKKDQAQNALLLAEERLKTQATEGEKLKLENEAQLRIQAIENERLKTEQESQRANTNEQAIKLQDLELEKNLEVQKNTNTLIGFLAFILVSIIMALVWLRRKNYLLKKQKNKIEEQADEIMLEQEKSEALLLNLLPPSVAIELRKHGKYPPKSHPETSILFTDFVGFTQISEKISPEELITELSEIFQHFDTLCSKNGLYRIKTIGDAYMCVGGVPEALEDHAHKTVKTALQMRDFIAEYNKSMPIRSFEWNIRIGVHSGPIVAGIAGIERFAYDVWGDNVNIASRLESGSEPGKVNISKETFELIKDHFQTEHRGSIHAKNKGNIEMYFVEHK